MKGASSTKAKNRMATDRKSDTAAFDWSRVDSLTDEEIYAAALNDPDAQPLTPERVKRMKRTPQVKVIRRAFRIPIGMLQDWEEGRAEPDQATRAYLRVIARNPKAVRKALEPAA